MKPFQIKVEKPWGYELIFTPPEAPTLGKLLHLNKGGRLSLQYHEIKEETLVLVSGEAKIFFGILRDLGDLKEEEMEFKKGYLIPNGMIHRVEAITDCDVLESSTKEEGKTVRLQDDYQRKDETEEERLKNRIMNNEP